MRHSAPKRAKMDTTPPSRYLLRMNSVPPTPLIPEEELRLTEARLAAFDRDGLGHTLDAVRLWSAARAKDPAAPCPTPSPSR